MDILLINHIFRQIYTNNHDCLETPRRTDIERHYSIPDYSVIYYIDMIDMAGLASFNFKKIDDVRDAAVLVVEIYF
jgi:hypothetical protein